MCLGLNFRRFGRAESWQRQIRSGVTGSRPVLPACWCRSCCLGRGDPVNLLPGSLARSPLVRQHVWYLQRLLCGSLAPLASCEHTRSDLRF